jgi:hypothetical protein
MLFGPSRASVSTNMELSMLCILGLLGCRVLDYVIESNIYEVLKYLRSFKLAAARRRLGRGNRAKNGGAGDEYSPQLFPEEFIRRLFTDGVTKTVMNRDIEKNTVCLVLPKKARQRLGKIASYLMVSQMVGRWKRPGPCRQAQTIVWGSACQL